jgi:phosphoribosyl-dephospho-CoA transferase
MEKAFRKLLKQILLKDYPMFADVHVTKVDNPFRFGGGYEVFLVILQDEWDKIKDTLLQHELRTLIYDLSKYMDINIIGVYNEVVSQEEWEEMTSYNED